MISGIFCFHYSDGSPRRNGRDAIFDVGINDPLPPGQFFLLGLQNVFGMTGMFVFPGLLGRSFNLPAEQIAYLYGMTFRDLRIHHDSAIGVAAAIADRAGSVCRKFRGAAGGGAFAKRGIGRGVRIVFCGVADLVRADRCRFGGFSLVGFFARYLRAPIISGVIVMLVICRLRMWRCRTGSEPPASPAFRG